MNKERYKNKMAINHVRYCFMCNTRIVSKHPSCKKHLQIYLENRHTDWCKYLVASEDRQARISVMESLPVFEETEHLHIVGKHSKYRDDLIVAERFINKLPIDDIARKYKLHIQTIKNILKKHREAQKV